MQGYYPPRQRQAATPPPQQQPPRRPMPMRPAQPPRPPRGSSRLGKWLVRLVVIAAVLAVAAYFAIQALHRLRLGQVKKEIAPWQGVYSENITIDGISLTGLTPPEAKAKLMENIQSRLNSWSVNVVWEEREVFQLSYADLGVGGSEQEINKYLNEAYALTHTGDEYQRQEAIKQRAANPYVRNTATSAIQGDKLGQTLQGIAAQIQQYYPPKNAEVHFDSANFDNPFTFFPESQGFKLDAEKAQQDILAMAAAGQSGTYTLQPDVVPPQQTVAQLQQTYGLITEARTRISTSSDKNRNHNIELAFQKINGTVLAPNEMFSFNKIVGQRTIEAGFLQALEMVSGELTTGIGGGVCQVSSTIFHAALQSNLKILDRVPHSMKVAYTDMGQDATVYWYAGRKIDFSFRNSHNSPIYITAKVEKTGKKNQTMTCVVRIYGQVEPGVHYEVESVELERIPKPLDPQYVKDTEHQNVRYVDEMSPKSDGTDGFKIETTLYRVENGQRQKVRSWVDVYQPVRDKIWVGTEQRPIQ